MDTVEIKDNVNSQKLFDDRFIRAVFRFKEKDSAARNINESAVEGLKLILRGISDFHAQEFAHYYNEADAFWSEGKCILFPDSLHPDPNSEDLRRLSYALIKLRRTYSGNDITLTEGDKLSEEQCMALDLLHFAVNLQISYKFSTYGKKP